ncbi:hypothetical protein LUZ60_004551 [Juncus effusus]|nr:hypothetical protein LUZ60_004551 [Juncus effusus]
MKKYGLNLRIPKSQPSKPAGSRPPPASVFGAEDDDDVEKEISRQASKTSSLRKVEEQHQKALEEDPSVFDYDGVYDEMKEKIAKPKIQQQSERKSKYIEALLSKAKEREREHEIVYERKLLKERSKEDHLYGDKEKFVTSAYKKKLAEQAKWLEEERLRKIREEQEDVTKKKDLSEFYFSLNKNIAFGAETETSNSSKPPKQKATQDATQEATPSSATADPEPKQPILSKPVNQPASRPATVTPHEEAAPSEEKEAALKQEESENDKEMKKESSEVKEESESKAVGERFKRKNDDLAAARERYLARKKAREQM